MPKYIHCAYPRREAIQCPDTSKCDKCGWDPEVQRQRKSAGFESQRLTETQRSEIMNKLEEKWRNEPEEECQEDDD